MKKILNILFLFVFFTSFVFAGAAETVVYQDKVMMGKAVIPKGIFVSDANYKAAGATKVYMGRLVPTEPPVVRGILIATPYTYYTAPHYVSSPRYYSDSNPVTDTLLTIGVIGGLAALFSLGSHHHSSHYSVAYSRGYHCW